MATVLIIEDDKDFRTGLADQLKKDGYDVLEAENGQSGFETALAKKPDMILLDYFIPQLNGIQVLKKLRQDKWGKTAKVMVITSMTDNEQTMSAQQYGISDFLIKVDWTFSDISARIQKQLSVSNTPST
jgi:two-component system response regulator VicR